MTLGDCIKRVRTSKLGTREDRAFVVDWVTGKGGDALATVEGAIAEIEQRIGEILKSAGVEAAPSVPAPVAVDQTETPDIPFARQAAEVDQDANDDLVIGAHVMSQTGRRLEQWSEAMDAQGIAPTKELFNRTLKYFNEISSEFTPPATRKLESDKKRIRTRIEQLRDKIARRDTSKKAKAEPRMDQEKTDLLYELSQAKEDYHKMLVEAQRAQRTTLQKVAGGIGEVFNTTRALMTSFDLSAVLRQGGFITLGHPIRAAKAFGPMLKAMASPKGQFAVEQEIRNRPNYKSGLYKQSKLYLSEEGPGVSLNKMEEAYASRWAEKIPGVGASQRAYTTFLNRLRADSFDAMALNLSRNGKPTSEQAKTIANYINVATGRGDMGKHATAAGALNKAFFAPRYVISRFQILTGQPLRKAAPGTRTMIAKEYGRMLAGMAVVYALAAAAGDDEVELDPRSSDFLKIKFGNTRIDPFFGLLQVTVLLSRLATGFTKTGKGELVPISGATKYGGSTTSDVIARFLRSKLAPIPGAVLNVAEGKNLIGEKVTVLPEKLPTSLKEVPKALQSSALLNSLVPISFGDIVETMEDQGVPRGTAFAAASMLGMGLQTYDATAPREKQSKAEVNRTTTDLNDLIRRQRAAQMLGLSEAKK